MKKPRPLISRSKSKGRSWKVYQSDDFFSDDGGSSKSLERYESEDYQENQEMTYDEHRSNLDKGGGCLSVLPKLAIFFLCLGLTFGLVFGFVDLEKINSVINNGGSGGGTGTSTDDNTPATDDATTTDDNTNQAPYVFNQCPSDGECCNGLPSNCDLRPNEMLWATVHNANHDDLLLANHEAPLEQALEAGYRGLMLDVCWCINGSGVLELQFCHMICGVGYRDPLEVFSNIGTFLDNNPTEVIFINFEISHGSPTPTLIWEVMKTAGLRSKTYLHDGSDFPSMRNLLLDGRQLIVSKHRGIDCTDPTITGCTGRIFEYFNEVIETHYSFNDIEAVEDTSKSCPGYRGVGRSERFYSINNFVTSTLGPSEIAADVINRKAFLEKRLQDCESITGFETNFVSVDFWQRGDLLQVTQETNLARAKQRRSWFFGVKNWFHI